MMGLWSKRSVTKAATDLGEACLHGAFLGTSMPDDNFSIVSVGKKNS